MEEEELQKLKTKNQPGELYAIAFNNDDMKARQKHIVYRQIGIDPFEEYSEEHLEDYIVLKALRDYNHSKFTVDDHTIIEGIIKDVF